MRDDTTTAIRRGEDAARGAGIRTRFEHVRSRRQRSALGLPEVAALAAAAALLLAAVLSYLFLLAPQRSRARALAAEREGLQLQLQGAHAGVLERKDTQASVREILQSLENFEVSHLGQSDSGTRNVIEELNRLIIKNNLRISGGVNYTQLQEAVPGAAAQPAPRREEGGARVVQSVFPGIGVVLTVEGNYQNLRRFIRDIEADRQFIVINSIELEGITDSGAGQSAGTNPDGTPAAGPARGTLVSLRLDLAAYFRRAGATGG